MNRAVAAISVYTNVSIFRFSLVKYINKFSLNGRLYVPLSDSLRKSLRLISKLLTCKLHYNPLCQIEENLLNAV